MTVLPDVNVLVALIWESHLHHAAAREWFFGLDGEPWATCSVTQTGFVRVSSNPKVLVEAISVREAVATLASLVAHRGHRLLTDGAGFVDNPLVPHESLVGHQQVTDAHLISIARQHDARVATIDRAMATLGGDGVVKIAT